MHNKINPINVPLELGSSPKNTGDMKKFNINMIIARLTNTLLMKNTHPSIRLVPKLQTGLN